MKETDLRARLEEDGFLVLHDVFARADIEEVGARLDRLFAGFDRLPASRAQDIAEAGDGQGRTLKSAEINRVLRVDRALGSSRIFRECRSLARALRGPLAAYSFDHAIAKQPRADAITPWHQDQVYTGHRTPLRTVHFWVPLQDVDEENGCMHFIPGSHRAGLSHHEPLKNASGGITYAASPDLSNAVAVPLAAGGLTIHTPLTMHFTGPNRTMGVRKAWILHFGPMGWLAKLHPAMLLEKYGLRTPH
jgi:hypothetical protein